MNAVVRKVSVYGLLVVLVVSMLFPFYWMATTSFKDAADVFSVEPKMFPGRSLAAGVSDDPKLAAWFFEPTTDNYPQLFKPLRKALGRGSQVRRSIMLDGFGRFLANNTFYALSITLGQVLTSSLAAFAFARLRFPGRDKLFLAYLGTMMIPITVTMIPSYILLRELGWLDSYKAVILPSLFTAYGTFMLRQFFMTIPREIEDAARIDGCNEFGLYWRIMLPLSTPALATLVIIVFVGSWRSFMWPLIVCSSEDTFNLPLGLTMFRSVFGDPQWPLLMAGSLVMTLPLVIVFVFGQRYFVEGIRLGAVKG
jgi:multiple sugar transport system permease protein